VKEKKDQEGWKTPNVGGQPNGCGARKKRGVVKRGRGGGVVNKEKKELRCTRRTEREEGPGRCGEGVET